MGIYPFEITGYGFELVPDNAVALLSIDNDAPLMAQSIGGVSWRHVLVGKSKTKMIFKYDHALYLDAPFYLGAIVSADGQTVYWTNNSRPLP